VTDRCEVAIIGGGPAGAALGTLVARAGYRVRLFEKEPFPRFHIGESLVPAINLCLERLGVLGELDRLRSPRKHGVQFFTPKAVGRPFYFEEVADPRMHSTWQVLRSEFDAMLLDNAVRAGVQADTGTEVLDVWTVQDVVAGVQVKHTGGHEEVVEARIVVDASGQNGVIARQFGGRTHIPGLRNTSVFAHYRDAVLDGGRDAGSTLIFRLDSQAWIWLIPLPDLVSIGLVAPAREISSYGASPAAILDAAIAACPALAERLAPASRTTEVRAMRDFSYHAERDGGPGWLLVGDALGFIDPIYSTGLLLALQSAELGADAVVAALGGRRDFDFRGFSAAYQAAFTRFLWLVRAFYSEDFHFGKFSMNETHRQGLVDLLTGTVDTQQAIGVTQAIREFFE